MTVRTSTGSSRTRPTSESSKRQPKKIGLDRTKLVVTVDRHANTSAPRYRSRLDLAIRDAAPAGTQGDAPGRRGGFTWGAALVEM